MPCNEGQTQATTASSLDVKAPAPAASPVDGEAPADIVGRFPPRTEGRAQAVAASVVLKAMSPVPSALQRPCTDGQAPASSVRCYLPHSDGEAQVAAASQDPVRLLVCSHSQVFVNTFDWTHAI